MLEVLKLDVLRERITWCFASNGMEALLRRPPTLITPPRKWPAAEVVNCCGVELCWLADLHSLL